MAAGSIIISLLMQTGSFVTDTQRAGKAIRTLEKEATDAGKKIGLAMAAAAAGVAAFAVSTLKGLDALNDSADATGATIENLSALEEIANKNGGTLEDVTDVLLKFNKALGEADGKNGVSRALEDIGLDAEQLRKLDPAEALRVTAVALAGFADNGAKARLESELFGKGLKVAAPLLKDLAEAGQLNATVTTEQAKAAEDLNKQIFALQTEIKNFARGLLGDAIPAVLDFIKTLNEARRAGQGSFFDGLIGNSQQAKLTAQAEDLQRQIETTTGTIERYKEALNRKGGNDSELERLIDRQRDRLKGLQGQAQATTQQLKDLADLRDPRKPAAAPEAPLPSLPNRPSGAGEKAKVSEAQRLLESLEKQLQKEKELTEVERVLEDIQKGRIEGLTPALTAYILAVAGEIDEKKELAAIDKELAEVAKERYDEQVKLGEKAQSEAQAIADQNRSYREQTEELGLSKEALYALEKARTQAALTLAESTLATENASGADTRYTQAIRDQIAALKERLGLITDRQATEAAVENIERIKKESQEMNEALRGSFEDSFVDFVNGSKSAGDAFKDFANSVIQQIVRIQAQKLALSLFGDGTSSSGGGWIGSLVNAAGSYFGGGSSGGGDVGAPGGFYDYGKSTPPPAMSKGGNVSITNKGEPVKAKSASQDANGDWQVELEPMVEATMAKSARRGGRGAQAFAQTFNVKRQPPRRA